MRLWLDGVIGDDAEPCIGADDRGFTLGDGVFETMRVSAGRVPWCEAHLQRLRAGATLLGIPVGRDDAALMRAMAEVLSANGLLDGSLRLTLSRGRAPRGLATPAAVRSTLLITTAATGPVPGPACLVTAVATRRNERSASSGIKSLSYLDNVLARREAERAGADDAILLNTRDRVAEATGANLVALLDGALLTPPVEDGALPGIMRGVLIKAGLLRTASLDRDALQRAEAMFLCNSLGIRGVASLDGRGVELRDDLGRRLEVAFTAPPPEWAR